MGGDESPHSFVSASLSFLSRHQDVRLLLFGDQAVLAAAKRELGAVTKPAILERLQCLSATDFVSPDDKPASALRHKRDSSMWLALAAVAESRADAILSAGNTGALMAMARYQLGMVAGLERPAICKRMPVVGRSCYVLDLGANTQASASQLHQFALMGAALVELEGVQPVNVGLLNIGEEHQKGTETLHEADALLRADSRFTYRGFVEGNALFEGEANVVVTDGFTGNVALKACEGLARYLVSDLRRYYRQSLVRQWIGAAMSQLSSGWLKRLNPAAYNGALLLGLNGVVVKSHGSADERGLIAALQVTLEQAERKPHRLLAAWLADGEHAVANN